MAPNPSPFQPCSDWMTVADNDAQILEILRMPRQGYCTLFEEIQALGAASPYPHCAHDTELVESVQTLLFDDALQSPESDSARLERSADLLPYPGATHAVPAKPISVRQHQQMARTALEIVRRNQRQPPVRVTTPQIDRTKSDYARLVNQMRARRRDIASGTLATDRTVVDVDGQSPLFAIAAAFGALLRRFHTLVQFAQDPGRAVGNDQNDPLGRLNTSRLRNRLTVYNTRQLDFSKPFMCMLHILPGTGQHVYVMKIHGICRGGKAVSCTLPDGELRALLLTHAFDNLAPLLTQASVNDYLLIREDGALSLRCLLAYYGVVVPGTARRQDLDKAIADLMPKESRGQRVDVSPALPFTIAEQPRFVLDTSKIYTFRQRTVEASANHDYSVIGEEIKKESQWHLERYRRLLASYTHFGASQENNEKALLALLQEAGGVTLKLFVEDSDGQADTYREQHTANPWNAADLSDYFSKAEEQLALYMENTLKYVEGEGAIYIEALSVELIVPNIVLRSHDLRELDIAAFDIRTRQPPFLYLDPLAKGSYEIIAEHFAQVTGELRDANWDISQCKTLTRAAQHLLRHYREDLSGLPLAQRDAAYLNRLKEVVNVYYGVVAQSLEHQQQLKVVLQPTQPEFVSRAICRYLALDERHWAMIAQTHFTIRYAAGWKNTGTWVRFEKSLGYRSLLSVVYDEQLRREVALADDCEAVLRGLAQAIADRTGYADPVDSLKERLAGLFDANIAFVNNGDLPAELTQPAQAFVRHVEAYTLKAIDEFRALEAERLVLTSGNAAERLEQQRVLASAGSDQAFYCIELLTPLEQRRLEVSVAAFAAFLRARANNDDIQAMSTAAQHVLQVVRQVGGLIPVVGNFINLGFDIYEGNTEGIALDTVNIFAELVLLKFRVMPPRVLGTLMLQGTNLWTMWQQIQALNASIKANDFPESVSNFGFLLLGMHSALHCGASVIQGFKEAVAYRNQESALEMPNPALQEQEPRGPEPESGPEYHTEEPVAGHDEPRVPDAESHTRSGQSANSQYWAINDDGHISERPTGRKVTGLDWNGNAIVEGGARALLLGGPHEQTYMLNGQAHRTVRGGAGPELRPLHALDIEAGQWRKSTQAHNGVAQFSRFAHTDAFPSRFSGRPERFQAPANAVSWYDNCIATLETVSTQVLALDGQRSRQDVAIGVIEHKYITERDGHIEVLEHAGSAGGKTSFIRADGTRLEASVALPATPRYQAEIQARIVAAQGMFVTVEISETLQGLVGRKTVAGVLATRTQGGGQELIIEADRGVHYRGTLAAANFLALAPGETSTEQQPVALKMDRISPHADPKRASPQLWHSEIEYRNGLAHDDFALELFYGAKAANEAFARNPQWVVSNLEAVGKIKTSLPPAITTVENPFYVLDTREELAILFAPRNQAALANTLLGRTIEWGAASQPHALGLGEKVLRQLRLHEPLMALNESIAPLARDRSALVERLKRALGSANLLIAEAEGLNGQKVYFAHSSAEHLSVQFGRLDDELHVSSSGSIIDHIEAHYPDPSALKNLVILSVEHVSEADARRIFVSSQRGYHYSSVTSLEPPIDKPHLTTAQLQLHIDDAHYPHHTRNMTIASAVVDLSTATPVTTGPRQGSYNCGGKEYVQLDNGRLYRAVWDNRHSVFVLVPPEGKVLANTWAYPWVRHTAGREFTLINRPGLKGGSWRPEVFGDIRCRNYERSTTRSGRLTAAQRRNNNELQVHHQDLHLTQNQTLQNGKLNVPDTLFSQSAPGPDGYVTLKSRVEVPESCISSTEYLVSRYAGGKSGFDYEGERSGQATALDPNVEIVARHDGREVSLNISTTALDSWIARQGHSDYFNEGQAFPDIGQGIGFIERHAGAGTSSDYEFHFMFVVGKLVDQQGTVTGVLATDLSEPSRSSAGGVSTTRLPASHNWNVRSYSSVEQMRGAPGPDSNAYPQDQYYSVLVRPVRS